MVTFRAQSPSTKAASALLDEYFTSRELGFTGGTYRVARPDPMQFEPPDGVFVIVDDGGDVGCGGIRRLSPSRFEVKHLFLRPSTRGKGLGRQLLAELERRAIEFGATEVVLDTNDSLEAAGWLYRSSGYETIEPYNDNPNATTWYRKLLDRPPRVIVVAPDYGSFALWEDGFAMEPSDYDLSPGLADLLEAWNRRWEKHFTGHHVGMPWQQWVDDGRLLADQLQTEVRAFADVKYEP